MSKSFAFWKTLSWRCIHQELLNQEHRLITLL